jgi:3-phosphoglycerate kinase
MQKELDYLDGAVKNPARPFCAIVGGSKAGAYTPSHFRSA